MSRVFEGAQGILLDMDFGLFPHVTRSRTTSANALALLQRTQPSLAATAEVHYITRAYHTRIPVLILPQQPQPHRGFCCQHCAEQHEAAQVATAAPEAVLA